MVSYQNCILTILGEGGMQLIERNKTVQPENKNIGTMIICILH